VVRVGGILGTFKAWNFCPVGLDRAGVRAGVVSFCFQRRLFHRGGGGATRAGKGIGFRPRAAAGFASAAAPLTIATGAGGARSSLSTLLLDQLIQLSLLEQLGEAAQAKAQHRHGGSQAEGLL
jgi:hypothetical protein